MSVVMNAIGSICRELLLNLDHRCGLEGTIHILFVLLNEYLVMPYHASRYKSVTPCTQQ